jgi:hypothetical protein
MSVHRKYEDLLKCCNEFATTLAPPPPQDEDNPAAKRQRLETFASICRRAVDAADAADAANAHAVVDTDTAYTLTASPNDIGVVCVPPTKDAVIVPASLPTPASASRARQRQPRNSWTPEENAKLTEAVKKHGGKNWIAIAALVPGRTHLQCRGRWATGFDTTIDRTSTRHNKGKIWTAEEDAKLTEAVTEYGHNWAHVAAMVPGRTYYQCSYRWVKCLGPTIEHTTGKWKPEEDSKLNDAVKEHGDNNWVAVAAMVPGRSNVQCRQRWAETLVPSIADTVVDAQTSETETTACTASSDDKIAVAPTAAMTVPSTLPSAGSSRSRTPPHKWTPEEDATLTEAVAGFGKDWVRVAALVPRRTNKQCGQRWVESLDPDINRGKWTLKEDAKLTKGVKKHGVNNWAAVAALVPGRIQIRCRQRWAKSLDPDINRGKWTPDEDTKLTEALTEHGNNWVQVATMVPGRTNHQCRHRWAKCLDPTIEHTKGKWKPEEDAKLTGAVKEHGENNSIAVAALVPGRTNVHVRNRWLHRSNSVMDADTAESATTASLDDSGTVRVAPTYVVTTPASVPSAGGARARTPPQKWTAKEDAKLTEAVTELFNDWSAITARVPGRTNKQCRQRWVDCLDRPTVDQTTARMDGRGKWALEEDAKLTDAVTELGGNDWVAIAALVPGRTNHQCRQRWGKTLDPAISTGKWTLEDDAKLTEAVKKQGKDWVAVAALVPGRTNAQCSYIWVTYLDPTIDQATARQKGAWTPGEDAKLTEAVTEHGNNWVQVATMVPGRTNHQCRHRWAKCLDSTIDQTAVRNKGDISRHRHFMQCSTMS